MNYCVAAVGTFDGLHRGHLSIIDTVLHEAEVRNMSSRIITFMNHPLSVIAPDRAPRLLLSRKEVVDRLEEYVDRVSEMEFTPERAALTAEQFLHLIAERYGVKVLVMGYDNSFGSDRLASRDEYRAAAQKAGIELVFVDPVIEGDRPVSSSRIRKDIGAAELMDVILCSGRFYTVSGTVVHGKHKGTPLGFPTLNLDRGDAAPLAEGVYACMYHDDDDTLWLALMNVGTNPTVSNDNKVTYEVHVPGARLGDRYGHTETVDVILRIRDEKKFDSVQQLKDQISQDYLAAITLYAKMSAAGTPTATLFKQEINTKSLEKMIDFQKQYIKRLNAQIKRESNKARPGK